jgi:hypothetical protein
MDFRCEAFLTAMESDCSRMSVCNRCSVMAACLLTR